MSTERRVLAIFPHPDDETLGKAGTIAQYTQAGVPVTLICGTLGEMGRNMGRPFFANRETLPKVREQELRDACAALGIRDLRLLHLRDKTVEFEDPERVADAIEAIMRELKPSLLLTYYPEHGVHPDHDALARAAIIAVKRLEPGDRPVVHASAVTRNAREVLGPPDFVKDVSDVLDIKIAAMKAHRSQTEGMFVRMEQERKSNPNAQPQQDWLKREQFWLYRVD
ncbi:MAG: bacillithiol biosynthesis deacetylase BshB2 [Firmicutes bacterium]|nr:bacillithiol biosynthesis deacetylase BshB2 [Bacillota bacterium]